MKSEGHILGRSLEKIIRDIMWSRIIGDIIWSRILLVKEVLRGHLGFS